MEHTQMQPTLKKVTKKFYYTSSSCGIFCDFTFCDFSNDGYEGPSII